MLADADIQEALQSLEERFAQRVGEAAAAEWAREVGQLVDLILINVRDAIAPWALAGSDEKIPLEKIDRNDLMAILRDPDFVSGEELLEALRYRIVDESALPTLRPAPFDPALFG